MKQFLLILLLVQGLALGAEEIRDPADRSEHILATLRERFPGVTFDRVIPSRHLAGYYEVVTDGGLVYSDAHGERIITGYVTDTRTQQNLTEMRWKELRSVDFSSLPLDLAIREVRGDGSRKLAIFSDPDCPFCQRLERQIESLDNVTLYTFLYPIEMIHPGAREKALRVWCAPDRVAVWADWMRRQVEPGAASCTDHPVDRLEELGTKLGINATPTLFLESGLRLEGALTPADLESAWTAPELQP